jgi:hypothetical protein
MEAAIAAWLYDVAIRAFGISLALVLVIDLCYAMVVFATRDRGIVNRWTSRILALNLVLAGTGVGVPVLALGSRVVVAMLVPFIPTHSDAVLTRDASRASALK